MDSALRIVKGGGVTGKARAAVEAEAEAEFDEQAAEERRAALNAELEKRFGSVIAEYAPKKQNKVLRIVIIILILLAVGAGIFLWVRHSQEKTLFKTGVMSGGQLCIAYRSRETVGSEFILSENGVLEETSRFAFSKFGGKTLFGRIYTPVSEGEVTLCTAYTDNGITYRYERFEVTVDGELAVTYTAEEITEEEYRELV